MSGRGRGRGRGRGGSGPRSISQQYLQNSAQEAGLDIKHVGRGGVMGGINGNGQIFPDLELHSSGERRLHSHESENLKDRKSSSSAGSGSNDRTKAAAEAENGKGNNNGAKVKQEPGTTATTSSSSTPTTATPTKPKSSKTIYLISKSRELHHRFNNSVFNIRGSTKEVPDVIRYSDRLRQVPSNINASDVLSHCLGGMKRTRGEGGGVFVPEELCGGQKQKRPSVFNEGIIEEGNNKTRGVNLAELAAKEGQIDIDNNDDEQKAPGGGGGGEDEEGVLGEEIQEDGEESDGADYVANYYESEGDESRGSDGEPTF